MAFAESVEKTNVEIMKPSGVNVIQILREMSLENVFSVYLKITKSIILPIMIRNARVSVDFIWIRMVIASEIAGDTASYFVPLDSQYSAYWD